MYMWLYSGHYVYWWPITKYIYVYIYTDKYIQDWSDIIQNDRIPWGDLQWTHNVWIRFQDRLGIFATSMLDTVSRSMKGQNCNDDIYNHKVNFYMPGNLVTYISISLFFAFLFHFLYFFHQFLFLSLSFIRCLNVAELLSSLFNLKTTVTKQYRYVSTFILFLKIALLVFALIFKKFHLH